MKIFRTYILKHLNYLSVPIIAMIITLAIDSIFPYLQKVFVDKILIDYEGTYLFLFFASFIVLVILRGIVGYIKEFLFDKFSLKISKEIRIDLFEKIESLQFSFFDKSNTGELLSRMGEDIDIIWETIAYGLRLLIEGIILFIISTIIIFYLNKKLAIVCISTLIPVAFLGIIANKKFWSNYSKISDKTAELNTIAQQDISGIRLVKSFAREKHEISKFLKINDEFFDLNINQSKILSTFLPFIELLTNFSPILMIVYGGYLSIKGEITIGTLLAFSSYILNLSWCVRSLGNLMNLLSQNKASMDKIFNILNKNTTIKSEENAHKSLVIKGEIIFDNVSFKYEDQLVLKDINLKIFQGQTIAIMGETGSGKSTLVSLIGRYYDVCNGRVLVDGIDVKEWNLDILRRNISVVFQDVFLFSDSIFNNISFGMNLTWDTVKDAAEKSCAVDFIDGLPEGYKTEIGERGLGLSGGQKQRLSIARAIARQASILILDDATSALDMKTEFDVLKNMSIMKQKPTIFIIAHRISGVKDADLILFMKDGEIVEKGTHKELIELKGRYYSVYCHQFQDMELIQGVG